MSSIVATITFVLCACESLGVLKSGFFDPVIDEILQLRVNQAGILENEGTRRTSAELDLIHEKLINQIPSLIITTNKIPSNNQEKETVRRVLNSNLYILVEQANDRMVEKVKSSLNFIVQSTPRPPRAKCLAVLTGDRSVDLANLFTYAWSLKFLDFSIWHNSTISTYNPFFDDHHASSTELFPDKLANMNGHKVRTLLFNRPPLIEFTNGSNGVTISGVNFAFLLLSSEFFNFSLDFVEVSEGDFPEHAIFEKIERGEIDVSIVTHGLESQRLYSRDLLTGTVVREVEMNFVAPIFHYTSRVNIYPSIISHTVVTAAIILVSMALIKLCNPRASKWTPLYIFALLFGVTVDQRPHRRAGKLVYIVLVVTSMHYSSCMFAIFSDDEVVQKKEVAYDMFQEIRSPSLPIYVQQTYLQDGNHSDEVTRSLKAHSVPIGNLEKCFEKLAAKKDRFCFCTSIYARYMLQKYSNSSTNMKIVGPALLNDYRVYVYPKASPYIRRFDVKFRQILESGLRDSVPFARKFFEPPGLKKSEVEFKPVNDIDDQIVIFTVGCVFAALAFVLELLVKLIF